MKQKVLIAALIVLGFCFVLGAVRVQPIPDAAENVVPVIATSSPAIAQKKGATFSLNGRVIRIEVADTEAARVLGLGGRESIGDDKGMLFPFGASGYHGIWMKGMRFSLDIIWLDENLRVVDMRGNVAPETYPQAFYPNAPAYYVLEMHAGAAAKNGIGLGSELILQK